MQDTRMLGILGSWRGISGMSDPRMCAGTLGQWGHKEMWIPGMQDPGELSQGCVTPRMCGGTLGSQGTVDPRDAGSWGIVTGMCDPQDVWEHGGTVGSQGSVDPGESLSQGYVTTPAGGGGGELGSQGSETPGLCNLHRGVPPGDARGPPNLNTRHLGAPPPVPAPVPSPVPSAVPAGRSRRCSRRCSPRSQPDPRRSSPVVRPAPPRSARPRAAPAPPRAAPAPPRSPGSGMVLSVLAGLCLAATLAMFATGLSDLRQMLATKSVENIQFLPFLTTDANNLSWLGYGCLKGDGTVITVNAIGAALQTLYILVYLYYSPAKRPVLLQVLLLLAVVVTGCGYFTILVDTGTRLTHLGLFCSVFTISMYLSPLADLAKVIRSKSTQLLSFPLTVTTLVASSSWTLYGLQLHDPYITVPNVPGIITSLVRFWLFQRYRPEQEKPYSPLPA
ncbi:sugar transporter SWEET1 isoform X2 [Agelaius tricolor]|uniref:sugar transporter SWEET1 isoform X2 n=1 Tax=Agelaius tricolor TaxID=9191 RepID=UPI0039F1756C